MGKKKSKEIGFTAGAQKTYFHLAARAINQPLYIEPRYCKFATQVLLDRMGKEDAIWQVPEGLLVRGNNNEGEDQSPYQRFADDKFTYPDWSLNPENGIATIPIQGTLMHGKGPMFASMGKGYQGIVNDARAAASDSRTKGLMAVVDSNGGEVKGCNEAALSLRKIADDSGLPFWTYIDEDMHSAAYWTGAQADHIGMPASASTGSIGAVVTHASYQQQLEERGMKITMIASGDKKTIGNPYFDLSESDYDYIHADIMRYADLFQRGVQQARSHAGVTLEDIVDTQAGTFIGQDAVDMGLADQIASRDDFFEEFAEHANSSVSYSIPTTSTNTQGFKPNMNKIAELTEQLATANQEVVDLTASNATLAEQVKSLTADLETAKGEADGHKMAAARFVEVMSSEEGLSRPKAAKELLADTRFAAFTGQELCEQLSRYEVENPDAIEGDDSPEMTAMLQKAKANSNESDKIDNRGELSDEIESDDKASSEKPDDELDAKEKRKPIKSNASRAQVLEGIKSIASSMKKSQANRG